MAGERPGFTPDNLRREGLGPEYDAFDTFPVETSEEAIAAFMPRYASTRKEMPIIPENLRGTTALITGSTRGIGLETARLFASYGAHVIIHGRPESVERATATAQEIIEQGGSAYADVADAANPEEMETLVQRAYERTGRFDTLVLNAGVKEDAFVHSTSAESVDRIFRTKVLGPFGALRQAVSIMRRNGGGQIVGVSSPAQFGFPMQVGYAAANAAIEAMMHTVALEGGRKGINASIIRPGFTETDMTSKEKSAAKAGVLSLLPSHRSFEPSEIAHGIASLASSRQNGLILNII